MAAGETGERLIYKRDRAAAVLDYAWGQRFGRGHPGSAWEQSDILGQRALGELSGLVHRHSPSSVAFQDAAPLGQYWAEAIYRAVAGVVAGWDFEAGSNVVADASERF